MEDFDAQALIQRVDELKSQTMQEHKTEQTSLKWLLPAVMLLALQFGSGVWWAASITARMAALEDAVSVAGDDRYRGVDAKRDFALRDGRQESLREDYRFLFNSIKSLESQISQHTAEATIWIDHIKRLEKDQEKQ